MKLTPDESAFILDCILRSFECKEMFYSLLTCNRRATNDILLKYMVNHPLSPVLLDLFHYTHSLIANNVSMQHCGRTYDVENITFHEKLGWIVKCKIGNAYLGKITLSPKATIVIGKLSHMSGNCVVDGSGTLKIGSYCSFAKNLTIITSRNSHHMETLTTYNLDDTARGSILSGNNNEPSSCFTFRENTVTIGNDVWLGEGVTIMNGVSLSHGCVIGTKALVTRNTIPYGIYGGIPARLIKKRFPDNMIKQLLEVKWWNWDKDKLNKNRKLFYLNIATFNGNLKNIIS